MASSSAVFISSPLPGTLTFFQNSSRICGIFVNACFRLASVRAHADVVPHHLAQLAVERDSTLRFPFTASSCFKRSLTSASACLAAGWSADAFVFVQLGRGGGEGSCPSC